VTVRSKDIAAIIKQYSEKDTVIVKMDIEGAEYEVLLDFIKKDVYKLIDHMYIEFHSFASPFRNPEDVLRKIITNSAVKFLPWYRKK
jgi:hypothetical protein